MKNEKIQSFYDLMMKESSEGKLEVNDAFSEFVGYVRASKDFRIINQKEFSYWFVLGTKNILFFANVGNER